MTDDPSAHHLRRALVEHLVSAGALRSEALRQAFERVPRHVFVPRFYDWDEGNPPGHLVAVDDDPSRLMPKVYADDLLPIEVAGQDITSSSSKPSMMAAFLEALDPRDGDRVLEIGTGSGYNAALLCERVGSEHVTTVEVDAALAAQARDRLASCGYAPAVAVADGARGYPPNAPYDRIVATCSVERIPRSWIEQTRVGGMIVTPLTGPRFSAGLVALQSRSDGTLAGHLRPQLATFMPLRGSAEVRVTPAPSRSELSRQLPPKAGTEHPRRVPPWLKVGPETFNMLLLVRMHAPDIGFLWRREDGTWGAFDGRWDGVAVVGWRDGSWGRARIKTDDSAYVAQGGPRRL